MDVAPVDALDRTVADPVDLGLDPARVDALLERARKDVDAGILASCQLALARHGRVAVHETFGDATNGARYVVFSCTKALVASAVWILLGEGRLSLDERVADLVPEFATNGKDVVTVEQVMLHTSGFPFAPLGPPAWFEREQRLAAFSRWRLTWEPGTRFQYHATSAHWVLAELVERVSGLDHRDFVRTRVLEPCGLTALRLGVPIDEQARLTIRDVEPRHTRPTPEELRETLGVDALPMSEVTPETVVAFNRPDVRALGVPGAGAVSDAADLALFYQALLHDPAGVWDPRVLADATSNVRNHFPDDRGTPVNRTIGLVVAGADGRSSRRGMGHTVSARTFGHDGAGGQIAWADPETGLSFAYLTETHDQHLLREWRRTSGLASRAAVCAAD
jgi:CubicO group peptidase (beta-lactamase class C family)